MGVRIEIGYEDIERVADCSELNNEIQNLIVFLKLGEIIKNVSDIGMRKRIFEWTWELWNDGEIGDLYNETEENYNSIEKQIDGIVKKLEVVLSQFKEKTNIGLYFEYDFNDNRSFFQLEWDDIIQFTPKVEILNNLNASFDLVGYDED
jgi:hypothetical protein